MVGSGWKWLGVVGSGWEWLEVVRSAVINNDSPSSTTIISKWSLKSFWRESCQRGLLQSMR